MTLRTLLSLMLLTNLWLANAWQPETINSDEMTVMTERSMVSGHDCYNSELDADEQDCLSHCAQASTLLFSAQIAPSTQMNSGKKINAQSSPLTHSPIYGFFRPPIA